MSQPVHLFCSLNGEDIKGESTLSSLDRADSIECLFFEDSVSTARERSTGMASGQRTYGPLKFLKRIDKSSPLLARGLVNNEVFEGVFKFYRPTPVGDGTTEHFFSVSVREGRLASIKRVSPKCTDPARAEEPPLEEVSVVFGYIEWTYEDGGVSHVDHWSQSA